MIVYPSSREMIWLITTEDHYQHHKSLWRGRAATGSQRTESSDDSDADVDVTTIGDDSSKLPFLSPLFGKTKMNNVLSSKYHHHRSSTQQNSASLLSSDDISALSQQKQSISEYLLQDKVKSSQQHSAVAPMPSTTGFSIEEIMRRWMIWSRFFKKIFQYYFCLKKCMWLRLLKILS